MTNENAQIESFNENAQIESFLRKIPSKKQPISFWFSALVKQLGEKHDLPVKSAYNSTRGFHAQMSVNNQLSIEDLPSQLIKVVRTKSILAFTTADLVS